MIDPAVEATCTKPGKTEGKHCSVCSEVLTAQTEIPATGHTAVTDEAVKPTCTETGKTEGKHCSVCSEVLVEQKVIPATGHTPGTAVRENEVAATCTTEGSYDEVVRCSACNAEISRESKTTNALDHDFGEYEVTKAATCTDAGVETRTCKREGCDATETREIPVKAHTPGTAVKEDEVAATCTTEGSYDEVVRCSNCNTELKREHKTIVKADHNFSDNLEYCANGCGTKNPNYVPPYQPPYIPPVNPVQPPEPEEPENPFTDVDEDDFFFDPVIWAVGEGITSGAGDGKFAPYGICTRAQMVTFLWRAAGKPEPVSAVNPFADVAESAYYYKAVLWAVEKGITKGTSAATFSPDDTCTRAQAMTFLYRLAGMPETSGAAPFTDVNAAAYYYNAVIWGVAGKITTGTSTTTFSPDDFCTRGQIVTFLYRYLVK